MPVCFVCCVLCIKYSNVVTTICASQNEIMLFYIVHSTYLPYRRYILCRIFRSNILYLRVLIIIRRIGTSTCYTQKYFQPYTEYRKRKSVNILYFSINVLLTRFWASCSFGIKTDRWHAPSTAMQLDNPYTEMRESIMQ